MPIACAAIGCKSHFGKDGVSLHCFPLKDEKRLKQWLKNMRRENYVPSRHSVLCSNHFEEECFFYQLFTNRRGLKNTAVPTKFIFPSNLEVEREETSNELWGSNCKSLSEKIKLLQSKNSSEELKQLESSDSYRPPDSIDSLKTTFGIENKRTIDLQTPSSSGIQNLDFDTPATLTSSLQCAGSSGLQCFSTDSVLPDLKSKLYTDLGNEADTSILEPQIIIKQEIIEPEEHMVSPQILPYSASCSKDSTSHVLESDICSSLGQNLVASDDINTRYPNLKIYFKGAKRQRPDSPVACSSKEDPPEESEVPETNRPKDQFDAFGLIVASKLRNLDWKSRAYVQKAIGDLLFEAELGLFLSPEEKAKFGEKNDSIINGLHEAVADPSS